MASWVEGAINHIMFPMVDATNFADLESGLTSISMKIYGTLRGNSAPPSLLSSGTHSFVAAGQSVTEAESGIYHIAIRPSDLSDAQQSFYDDYIFWASDTGTAVQIIPVTGVRYDVSDIFSAISDMRSTMDSQFAVTSNYLSNVSNYLSAASNMLSSISVIASDAHSAAILGASHASNALSIVAGNSNILSQVLGDTVYISDIDSQVLLNASAISDIDSALTSQFTALSSQVSDIESQLDVTQSLVSDIDSQLTETHSLVSDVDSQLTITHDLVSDIDSQLTVTHNLVSDVESALDSQFAYLSNAISDHHSAFDARWPASLTELGVAAPAANPSPADALMLQYMALRNRLENTPSWMNIYNDAGTVIAKASLVWNSSTSVFDRMELESG